MTPRYGPRPAPRPAHVTAYLEHARIAGRRPATLSRYAQTLTRAERTLPAGLLTATPEDLAAWLGCYGDPQTRRSYRADLVGFYRWARRAGLVDRDPLDELPVPRVPTRLPRPLADDDVAALLTVARDHAPHRALVWVLLMAYAGLRSVEVANTGPDHLTGRRLFLPVCKGGGQGWVTLPDWVALEVAAADPWQVTPPTVRRVVGSVMRDAGVTGTPHQLRHWFGTTTLRACGNLRVVQGLMRHASPASTALYTLVEDTERTAVVDSLPRLTPGPVPTHTLEDTR